MMTVALFVTSILAQLFWLTFALPEALAHRLSPRTFVACGVVLIVMTGLMGAFAIDQAMDQAMETYSTDSYAPSFR